MLDSAQISYKKKKIIQEKKYIVYVVNFTTITVVTRFMLPFIYCYVCRNFICVLYIFFVCCICDVMNYKMSLKKYEKIYVVKSFVNLEFLRLFWSRVMSSFWSIKYFIVWFNLWNFLVLFFYEFKEFFLLQGI